MVGGQLPRRGSRVRIPSSAPLFCLRADAEVAELADAADSKSAEGQPSCRVESGLRHQPTTEYEVPSVRSGVTVAHGTLDPMVQVRILAPQPGGKIALPGSSTVERAAVNR